MNFLRLKPIPLFSSVRISLTRSPLILLALMAFCHTAPAQGVPAEPVARLVSEPAREISRSRPRQVAAKDGVSATPAALPSIEDATTIERRAFDKTNDERVKNELAKLAWDPELCHMARVHSENMARLEFFGHETPEGLRLKERARSLGIVHFRVIAENIAYNKGYEDPGAFAVERWMISAAHRANILYVGFQASAVGSYVSADGTVYLTQVFINR